MKLYSMGETILLIVGMAALVGFLSSKFLGDDNLVEETAENVIEQHTGIDLDLTPESEE